MAQFYSPLDDITGVGGGGWDGSEMTRVRVCNTSLGGNGLQTHIIYKFEFDLSVPGHGPSSFQWHVQKRHRDFQELAARIREEGGAAMANGLGKLPKHETVLSIYAGGASGNILKRCRKLCAYLRNLVGSEGRDLRCVREFLGMAGEGRGEGKWGATSNFETSFREEGGEGEILREGYVEVCVNSTGTKDVTYFKRRYAVLVGGGLFLYRHHDDDWKNFKSCLDGGEMRAERGGGGGKGFAYWRIWVEEEGGGGGQGGGAKGAGGKYAVGGEGGSSYFFRGTDRQRDLWMEAMRVKGGAAKR
ncbi:hypothetical protein TrRE_jg7468 [Triparma retinervis]|uniref:PX domain-containing protein n=1 Tax=Triparma retinervis TaxID=2557542 RepID=A0A9W7KTH0_9STRA|nr:hypothetical protein TrRE_jg7468 [Triparma retinervis]